MKELVIPEKCANYSFRKIVVKDSIHVKGWLTRHAARVRLGVINLISFSEMYDTTTYKDWELLFSGREG